MIDSTPDPSRSDRITGMKIVSVNGKPTRGEEANLTPGRNQVRVSFSWPKVGRKEVDLDFKVKAGTIYVIYYGVHPLVARNPSHVMAGIDHMWDATDPDSAPVILVGSIIMTPLGIAETAAQRGLENNAPSNYVDVMVVAQQSLDGIVCHRRVHPDGGVETR